MILLDSSVLFDHTRGKDPRLVGWFQSYSIAVCGIVRAEVLHGARNASDRAKLIALLNLFGQLPLPDMIWDNVGDNLAILRTKGVTVPFNDVILATLAIVNNVELWTRDQHFTLIQQRLPALLLFQEPP